MAIFMKDQAKRTKEKNQPPKNHLPKTGQKNVVPLKKLEKKQAIARKERPKYLEKTKDFLRGVNNELKKVHWLTRREVAIYTGVVLVAVVIVGALIWLFDSLLSFLLQLIIK